MKFIGRRKELEELNARFISGRFEMGVIYGARRIGKTSLINEFVKDKNFFYFQAKESNELANGIGKSKDHLLVAECKYRSEKTSLGVYNHLIESLSVFPNKEYDIYLFSRSGFTDDFKENVKTNVHLITPEEMV